MVHRSAGLSGASADRRRHPGPALRRRPDGRRVSRVGAFSGSIGELVDGARARMWTFTSPGIDAQRHETAFSAFVADRIQAGGSITAEVGLTYDGVRGSAESAAQGISWDTLLPSASIWWAATKSGHTWIFAVLPEGRRCPHARHTGGR